MVTGLSVMIIQNRVEDVKCEAYGPNEDGLWMGVINLYNGEDLHTSLISSEPVYNSPDEAIAAMNAVVAEAKAFTWD